MSGGVTGQVRRGATALAALAAAAWLGVSPAVLAAPPAGSPRWSAPAAAAAAGAAPAPAAGQRLLYTIRGTPHTWLADEHGTLHWVGDSIALARAIYTSREYTLEDPLDPALRRSLGAPMALGYEQMLGAPRGEPLLSTAFVEVAGAVYYPRWETFDADPVLLRLASPDDLSVFGVTPASRDRLVLSASAWEQRYGRALDELERDDLRGPAPATAPPVPCLPVVEEIAAQPAGAVARLSNPCGAALRVRLSAVLFDREGGRPLATTGSAAFDTAPGDTYEATLSIAPARRTRPPAAEPRADATAGPTPSPAPVPAPERTVDAHSAQPLLSAAPLTDDADEDSVAGNPPAAHRPAQLCLDVGASGCLSTDPWLRQAVDVLRGLDQSRPLLETAADFGVALRRGRLAGALGQYSPEKRTITIAASIDESSDWERAAVLAHELQHAADHVTGVLLLERGSVACLAHEQAAFSREAAVWQALWQGTLPEPRDRLQADLNQSVRDMADPAAQADTLARRYVDECAR